MVDSDVANAECKAMRYVPLSVALNKTWEAAHDSCNLWISATRHKDENRAVLCGGLHYFFHQFYGQFVINLLLVQVSQGMQNALLISSASFERFMKTNLVRRHLNLVAIFHFWNANTILRSVLRLVSGSA